MSRTTGGARSLVAALAALAVVLASGLTTTAAGDEVVEGPQAGASGVGDPYWPLDGNGGIDVRHYDVAVDYDFATGELSGTTTARVLATDDLSSFGLDLLLPVTAVSVDGVPATFAKPSEHELRVQPDQPL